MLATSLTAAVVGVEAHLVRVEADTASGFPRFTMLGLPDSAIKESEGRIRAALRNCGYGLQVGPAHHGEHGARPACARRARPTTWPPRWACWPPTASSPRGPLADVLLVGELALDGARAAGQRRAAR